MLMTTKAIEKHLIERLRLVQANELAASSLGRLPIELQDAFAEEQETIVRAVSDLLEHYGSAPPNGRSHAR